MSVSVKKEYWRQYFLAAIEKLPINGDSQTNDKNCISLAAQLADDMAAEESRRTFPADSMSDLWWGFGVKTTKIIALRELQSELKSKKARIGPFWNRFSYIICIFTVIFCFFDFSIDKNQKIMDNNIVY